MFMSRILACGVPPLLLALFFFWQELELSGAAHCQKACLEEKK